MSAKQKLKVVPLVTRIGRDVVKERVAPGPAPTSLQHVPASAESLTTNWLTAALCRDTPGAAVERFEIAGGSDGTSSRRALRVTYNAAGQEAGLPTRLFTKAASTFRSRLLLGLTGIVEGETIFYRDMRPELELRSPRAYYATFDPYSFRSIVVLDDLTAEGWTFPDPMHDVVDLDDARDMVDQMARYHAHFWDDPRLTRELARLPTSHSFQQPLNAVGFEKRCRVGIERSQDVIPPALYRRRDEVWPAVMRSLELNTRGVPTLLHQDLHPGNWLRDADGRKGLYDWQCVARGEWALDVAYALTVNLTVEDRRAWEHELLEHYLARLAEQGVERPPSFDQAWLRYRQQPFHALSFGLFTIGAGRFQPDMQPRDYTLRCIKRMSTAIDDLASLDSLT